jgi:hypothetical protein
MSGHAAVKENVLRAGCSICSGSATCRGGLEAKSVCGHGNKRPAGEKFVGGLKTYAGLKKSSVIRSLRDKDLYHQATRRIAGISPVIPTTNSSKIFASRADAESASG